MDFDSSRYGKLLLPAAPKPSRRVNPLLLQPAKLEWPASFCGWFQVTPGKLSRKVAFSSQQEISWERWRSGLELGHRRWGGWDSEMPEEPEAIKRRTSRPAVTETQLH